MKVIIFAFVSFCFLVLGAGLEPAQPQWPRDFKSRVSTDSTIRATSFYAKIVFYSFGKRFAPPPKL